MNFSADANDLTPIDWGHNPGSQLIRVTIGTTIPIHVFATLEEFRQLVSTWRDIVDNITIDTAGVTGVYSAEEPF